MVTEVACSSYCPYLYTYCACTTNCVSLLGVYYVKNVAVLTIPFISLSCETVVFAFSLKYINVLVLYRLTETVSFCLLDFSSDRVDGEENESSAYVFLAFCSCKTVCGNLSLMFGGNFSN